MCQKSEVAIFADDTSIVKAGKTDDCSVQNELETLTDWFNNNKLSINTSKCESISFGRMYQRQLTIMEKMISQKNCCKYLGLFIDPVLTFRDHINHVVKKLNKFCGLIYRVRDLYRIKALLSFYNSYAKSVISYGLIFYGRAAKTNLQNIEMAQRRIIRAIFFFKIEIASGIYFVTLKLIPFLSYSLWMFFVKYLVNYAQMKKRVLLQS